MTDPLEGTWVNSPFEQSDVLIFHSLTVHQGRSFQGERLRLSIDGRFQRARDPIDHGSLLPHGGLIDWEDIYADWPEDQLQYYWQQWDLTVTEYDSRYHDQRDRMAMEMARRGDPRAFGLTAYCLARHGFGPASAGGRTPDRAGDSVGG